MLLGWVIQGVVVGAASAVGSIWAKRKLEKKTDQQTAELKAQVNKLVDAQTQKPVG